METTTQTTFCGKRRNWPRSRALMAVTGSVLALLALSSSNGQAPAQPAQAANRMANDLVTEGVDEQGQLRLAVNKSAVINTRTPYSRVSVGNPDIIADNQIGETSLLITARQAGTTQLIIWDEQERSQVIDVTVDFDLHGLQNQMRVMFPNGAIDVSSVNGTIALRGTVPSLQVAEQATALAEPYARNVLNFLEVSGGQQIMLQVRFAEVSRAALVNLGFSGFATDGTASFGTINGPGGRPIGAAATGQETTIEQGVSVFGTGAIGNVAFEYFLSALRQNNLLRVLAEPNLIAMSGEEASFLAGGEFPVPVPQNTGAAATITVEFKRFGIQLNFVPVVLGDGRIRLKVAPEVSALDYSNAVVLGGFRVPALTTRNVNTTVELAEGQTFAIAGLLNSRMQANREAVPVLGDVPVLGKLFSSIRYERQETELLVLVTPRLVEGMNPDQVPALPVDNWRYPNEAELLLKDDLGGPQEHSEDNRPAPRYQGEHGFTPAPQPIAAAE
jgi:pilus assembly protein CpaC